MRGGGCLVSMGGNTASFSVTEDGVELESEAADPRSSRLFALLASGLMLGNSAFSPRVVATPLSG